MLETNQIPSDFYIWIAISSILYVICIRSFISNQRKRNTVSKFFGITTLVVASGYFAWAISLALTRDIQIIKQFTFVGDVLIMFAIGLQAFLFWYLMLRNKISLWWLIIPAFTIVSLGIYSVINSYKNDDQYVYFTDTGELSVLQLPIILMPLFVILFLPLAYFFAKSSFQPKITRSARFRSVALAAIYAGFALIEAATFLLDSDGQSNRATRIAILGVTALFGLLFFVFANLSKKSDQTRLD